MPFALTYLDFPREYSKWIRTNNVQEGVNFEVKRRTRVVTVFPSVESLVRLDGVVCLDQNDAWLDATNFMDPRGLCEGYESPALQTATGVETERFLMVVEGAFLDKLGEVA